MKVTLKNGTELEALTVRGEVIFFQNASRDCLSFHFDPEKYTLSEIDSTFTPENCTAITLADDDGTYLHENYTIRRSIEKTSEHSRPDPVAAGASDGTVPPEDRIIVRMAQVNYAEKTQAELLDAVDAMILSSLEG